MGRKKIRNYPSVEFYEGMLKEYFDNHSGEVIGNLLDTLGYESVDSLLDAERNMAFGFDCGWIHLHPRNHEMRHEWELDNGKYCAYVYVRPTVDCQSTTIKKVQAEKAVKDLGLGDKFFVTVRLD